jgi:hypothetical protein
MFEYVTRSRKWKKERQYNDQKKDEKRQTMTHKNRKQKIKQHESHLKPRLTSCTPEGWSVSAPLFHPSS